MPVEQITIPTPEDVKVYHHEQNRRITFETLNTKLECNTFTYYIINSLAMLICF